MPLPLHCYFLVDAVAVPVPVLVRSEDGDSVDRESALHRSDSPSF